MLTLIANNHYAPAACLLGAVQGWLYVCQLSSFFLPPVPSNALFATSKRPITSSPSLKFIPAHHHQILFCLIPPSLFTPYSPLSFSASLYPPLLPRKGVMPSLAREPKPRCLRWLLLETRSCREDRGGRDRTKVKESKKGMERGKKKGERSTGGLDE